MTEQQHVFISYVRENRKQVDRLARDLERHGVNVWLDRNSIKPGARWKNAIRKAIRSGNFFIACFSKEYNLKAKTYMNAELSLAVEELRQYASNREWFVPVLFSKCDVPALSLGGEETLLDINWVPLYEDWESGVRSILSVIHPEAISDTDKLKWCLVLSATVNDINRPRAKAIFEHIQELSQDATLTMARIGPGSVKIYFEGEVRGFLKISSLFESKKLGSVLGFIKVWSVEVGEPKEAIPVLVKALKDKKFRCQAAKALENIGPEAVPALAIALKDADSEVRKLAVLALGEIGSEALPALSEAFKSKYVLVRRLAAQAIENIDPERTTFAIIGAYKDKNVLYQTVHNRRNIGPDAKNVLPSLTKMKTKKRLFVRRRGSHLPHRDQSSRVVIDMSRQQGIIPTPTGVESAAISTLIEALKIKDPDTHDLYVFRGYGRQT